MPNESQCFFDPNKSLWEHLYWAISENNLSKIEQILQSNPTLINQRATDARTALTYATMWGHEKVALLLIRLGADVTVIDHYGKDPIYYATSQNMLTVIQQIISLHPRFNVNHLYIDNLSSTTLLHISVIYPELVRFYLAQGADQNLRNSNHRTVLEEAHVYITLGEYELKKFSGERKNPSPLILSRKNACECSVAILNQHIEDQLMQLANLQI